MRAFYNRGAVVITDGEVTPRSLRRLRFALRRVRHAPRVSGYYDLTLTAEQADELSVKAHEELVYFRDAAAGLGVCEGFRIVDIGWEVLVDPEPAGRSSLVSGTVAGDNLDVVEGQANGEGQGIGFDDADLGVVEPGIGGEGTIRPANAD